MRGCPQISYGGIYLDCPAGSFPEVSHASLQPDPTSCCFLPSRRRFAIPSSCWSGWRPQVLPPVLVAPVVPRGAAEWQVMPPHQLVPAGQEDAAPAACGIHWRANKWLSSKAVCSQPGPAWCCAFVLVMVEQVVHHCGEDGQLSCGSPHYGVGSSHMAWTCRWGWSLWETGCGSPCVGQQGWCGFGSSSVLVLSPRSRAVMFADRVLAEQGAKGGPGITQSLTL